jgi:hypothetical protein
MEDSNLQFPSCDYAEIIDIGPVNIRPHPFVVGPNHVTYAVDNNSGRLDESVMNKIPCAECNRPYSEHQFDTVAVVKLKRDCKAKELQDFLGALPRTTDGKAVVADIVIDGFVFAETEEKFRIKYPDQENS